MNNNFGSSIEIGAVSKSIGSGSDWPRFIGWKWKIVLVTLAIWLVSPVLTSTHPEAFTAIISILAIAAHDGYLADGHPSDPTTMGAFYLLRLGVSLLLQFLQTVSGSVGDWQFRVLMIVSLVAIVSATAVMARRWAKVEVPASAAALLLTSGLVQSSFIFNDNLISAAFVTVGLSMIAPHRRWWIYLVAGGFVGFGILCRVDAILLLPVAAGLIWLSVSRWSEAIVPGIALALGIIATSVIGYWAGAHATVLDVLKMTLEFQDYTSKYVGTGPLALQVIKMLLLFFGVPMLLLLPFGTAANYRDNRTKWNIVWVAFPILFLLLVLPNTLVPRHFLLLLTPFIGVHGGRAIEILVAALRRDAKSKTRVIVMLGVAACLAIFISPPVVLVSRGPFVVSGQLWSPFLWFHWQRSVSSGFDRLEEIVIVAGESRRTVVVSSHYNDDFYLHLRLVEGGFQLSPEHHPLPGCGDGFDLYRRGDHELVHIRTTRANRGEFRAIAPRDYLHAIQIQAALRCQTLFASDRFYFTGWGDVDETEKGRASLTRSVVSLNDLYGVLLDKRNLQAEWEYYDNIGVQNIIPGYYDFLSGIKSHLGSTSKRPQEGLIRVTEIERNQLRELAAKSESLVNTYRSDPKGFQRLPSFDELDDYDANRKLSWRPPSREERR